MDLTPLCEASNYDETDRVAARPDMEEEGWCNQHEVDTHALFMAIHNGDLDHITSLLTQNPELVNYIGQAGSSPLHVSCQVHHLEIMNLLLKHGAEVELFDNFGNTALHVAVKECWHDGIKELLDHGSSPNEISSPTGITESYRETPLHTAVRLGDLKSVSMLLQYSLDLSVKDSNNNSVVHLAASLHRPELLELLVREPKCAFESDNKNSVDYTVFHAALSDCKDVADSKVVKVLELLWSVSHDINKVNLLGESPLFLACRSGLPNVVSFLLSKGCDPMVITNAGQSSLHSACQAGCSITLKHLLSTGLVNNLVTKTDNDNNSPFYFAAQSSSNECCEILLKNGAHLTDKNGGNQTNCSLVLERLPSALQLLRKTFDAHISLCEKSETDPGFSVSFDYSVLLSSKNENIQSSIISELIGSSAEPLIKHPLLEGFLFIKWRHISSFFYFYVTLFLIYVLMHTSFIFMTFGENPVNWSENTGLLLAYQISHIHLLLLTLIPDTIIMFSNYQKYLLQWETYSKLIAHTSSVILVFLPGIKPVNITVLSVNDTLINSIANKTIVDTEELSVERQVASISSFFIWVEFMLLLGRFPELGSFILMFTRVAKSIIRFLMAFLSLIIGFSISFYILFHKVPVFANYQISFVKILMMMTGEIAYSEFVLGQKLSLIHLLFLILLMFMIPVLLANLLIGLAVNDLPSLKRQGKIKRLVKEATYLVGYETFLAYTLDKRFFPRHLHNFLTSKSRIKSKVTVKPNQVSQDPLDKYNVPRETLYEAITLAKSESSLEDFSHHFDDIETLFKTFQARYSADLIHEKKKIRKIIDICIVMKAQLDHLQQHIMEQKSKPDEK
ncbi:transient receptor potential channel pyrexia-like [Macrobrachium rosenbergii]|uniref:transient receptor potential channel pyrexia-like n=1 Tax=Macrobrachium rosenbergii TaxID=79674 RepID=UPI0034D47DEE